MDTRQVIGRLAQAGSTLWLMASVDSRGSLPPADQIDRMDDVLGEWMPRLGNADHRRAIAYFVAGVGWDTVAARSEDGRSADDWRCIFASAINFLAGIGLTA